MSVSTEEIRQSVDMKWYLSQCAFVGFLIICFTITSIFLAFFSLSRSLYLIILLAFSLIGLGSYEIYIFYQIISLIQFRKQAVKAIAYLDDPHFSLNRKVYFCITVEAENGELLAFETKAIYGHSLRNPRFDEYNGKTVRVAYNEEDNRIVVLDLLDI